MTLRGSAFTLLLHWFYPVVSGCFAMYALHWSDYYPDLPHWFLQLIKGVQVVSLCSVSCLKLCIHSSFCSCCLHFAFLSIWNGVGLNSSLCCRVPVEGQAFVFCACVFLGSTFDHLIERDNLAKCFLPKSDKLRRIWLENSRRIIEWSDISLSFFLGLPFFG